MWWKQEDYDSSTSLPRVYDRSAIQQYWRQRPLSILFRLGQVLVELGPIGVRYLVYKFSPFAPGLVSSGSGDALQEQIIVSMARELKDALTQLGPAWVKAGQQLAIRPDLVHPAVLKELQKLCDAVKTTLSKDQAIQILQEELGYVKSHINLQDLELVASASLGQVYKATLLENKAENMTDVKPRTVAIKIQRPGMLKSFSLDLFLLQLYGDAVDSFTSTFTKQPPFHRALFDTFSEGSYLELDYENEAQNQLLFQREISERGFGHKVKIPEVFLEYTTQRVLVTEWIDGVPLAQSPSRVIQKLIPVGVELFLLQLLDIGTFHSDPHPGNIFVTNDDGILCLLDFGLCAKVDPQERKAMTQALVHLLYRDFDALVDNDSKDLGFLPHDFDTTPIKPLLTKILNGGLLEAGSNMKTRKRKFMEISNELNEVFFNYPFQVPPFFALVTRGLGLLEGIALSGDPDFDIFQASLPFVASRRAVSLLLSGTKMQNQNTAVDPCEARGATKNDEGIRQGSKNFFGWLVSKLLRSREPFVGDKPSS